MGPTLSGMRRFNNFLLTDATEKVAINIEFNWVSADTPFHFFENTPFNSSFYSIFISKQDLNYNYLDHN